MFDAVMIPDTKRNRAVWLTKKILVALFVTLIFCEIALVPRIGYLAEARISLPITRYSQYGFAIVDFGCNSSFNPLLYPVSWLSGRGYLSGNFSMIYLPQSYGGESGHITWGKQKVIESEASMKVVLNEFYGNVPVLPALFVAIELSGWRRLYLWFLGGVLGYVLSAPIGVFVGLLVAVFSTFFILPKLRETWARQEASSGKLESQKKE